MLKRTCTLIFILLSMNGFAQEAPLKVAVIGLTHSHVHWIFGSEKRGDFEIVAIVEKDEEVIRKYADQYHFSKEVVYPSIEAMLEEVIPEAATAFGPIYDHLEVVEKCAPRGIHVMVEKPLAVSLGHARKMKALAEKHNIHLLTNYETTWYPTNHLAYEMINEDSIIGPIRKIIVRDGHKGPKKINVPEEFFEWLTDPTLNGGGAITDFGCYGANLLTWLKKGERPVSVTAVTQQLQKENNPLVDDEAIILVEYPDAIGIVEASWNWPIGRKDMEVYGIKGVIYAENRHDLKVRLSEGYDGYSEENFTLKEREAPLDDPFALLNAVIKGKLVLEPFNPNSLENNMIVMEILDAAIRSAKDKKTVYFK